MKVPHLFLFSILFSHWVVRAKAALTSIFTWIVWVKNCQSRLLSSRSGTLRQDPGIVPGMQTKKAHMQMYSLGQLAKSNRPPFEHFAIPNHFITVIPVEFEWAFLDPPPPPHNSNKNPKTFLISTMQVLDKRKKMPAMWQFELCEVFSCFRGSMTQSMWRESKTKSNNFVHFSKISAIFFFSACVLTAYFCRYIHVYNFNKFTSVAQLPSGLLLCLRREKVKIHSLHNKMFEKTKKIKRLMISVWNFLSLIWNVFFPDWS